MQTQQGYGLRPTPFDARDFPIEKVLGAAAIGTLPQEYIVSTPLVIKDKTDDWTAKKYAKQTYLSVKPIGDVFDGMRSAMWQTRSEERSVFTGIDWNPKWNRVQRGVIDAGIGRGEPSFGHAIKIFGWSGEWMLAQLSNGKEIGDGGIFKLERGVVNEFCTYGAFTLLDLPREDAERALGKIGWFSYWLKSVFA